MASSSLPVDGLPRALLATHALNLLDDQGHPLREQADPRGASAEVVACPYADSRLGQPMNRTALTQVSGHWAWIQAAIHGLTSPQPDVHDVWRTLVAATTAPLAWSLSETRPLPSTWAALYKTCVGYTQVFCHLLLTSECAAQPATELGTPDEFWAWLQQQGWLHGARQVCGGSRAQITGLFTSLTTPVPGLPPPDLALWQVPLALESLALQTALALATYRAPGALEGESLGRCLLERSVCPWFFAVTARPGRPPALARRFFRPGQAPTSLEEFLCQESPNLTPEAREDLFWKVLRT